MRKFVVLAFVGLALLTACGRDRDEEMWDCQLSVQKENAGKDAEAAAERLRDIEACMAERGFRLDVANPACRGGSTAPWCYVSR